MPSETQRRKLHNLVDRQVAQRAEKRRQVTQAGQTLRPECHGTKAVDADGLHFIDTRFRPWISTRRQCLHHRSPFGCETWLTIAMQAGRQRHGPRATSCFEMGVAPAILLLGYED
jgi:hypothetical protein